MKQHAEAKDRLERRICRSHTMELILIVVVLVLLFGGGGGYFGRRRGYW
jgi:hypothetical protein